MSQPDPDTTQTDTGVPSSEAIAAAFGRDLDPLAEHVPTFERLGIDGFEKVWENELVPAGLNEKTLRSYETCYDFWRDYMAEQGRHPACPNSQHVAGFIQYLRDERENSGDQIYARVRQLQRAFRYWQVDSAFPHSADFDPFGTALRRTPIDTKDVLPYVDIPDRELLANVRAIKHVRERAIVVAQLKLGLRASEVTNIKLRDINLTHSDISRSYPDLGSRPEIEDHENAIIIPSKQERDGNKSQRARILPLDDEVRQAFIDYLLARPTDGQPWLFLTKVSASKMRSREVRCAWQDQFWPEYRGDGESTRHINSHYGRHHFSTYWRIEQDMNRELVKYMRGDVTDKSIPGGQETIDSYIHTSYEDIEDIYRERIFKFGL